MESELVTLNDTLKSSPTVAAMTQAIKIVKHLHVLVASSFDVYVPGATVSSVTPYATGNEVLRSSFPYPILASV